MNPIKTWGRGLAVALLAFAALLAATGAGAAASLRWAAEEDAASLDPYTRDEIFQLSLLGNVYEPLVRRDAGLSLQPGLATAWEQVAPTRWRFHLRRGVRWQDGSDFTAADVLFSLGRVQSPGSLLQVTTASVVGATAPDPFTVEFQTAQPDAILPQQFSTWYIMSKAWAEAHATVAPRLLASKREDYATRNAMGTGPYRVTERDPDHRTVLLRNPLWWDQPDRLIERVEMNVLTTATSRVAALASGEVDLATAIPPQDAAYVAATPGLKLIAGPELRTIFLGMDESRPQLLKSNVTGRNPFRDMRVREAVGLAIDEDQIVARVLRGQGRPAWLLWAPGVSGYDAALDHRPPPDPELAKKLLAEAGYPQGFSVTLDCPNDRYVMDEAICTALASMLARVGIEVTVNAQPKARFFNEVGPPAYRASFYLLGWMPPTLDALNVLVNLAATRKGAFGQINFEGFSDPALDALVGRIGTATNPLRNELIDDAAKRLQAAYAYIPLHQQRLLWGANAKLTAPQSPDGTLQLRLLQFSP